MLKKQIPNIIFDFFDGLAARLLSAQSELGLQLDSLADMVTSGLVPGIVMYQLLTKVFGKSLYMASETWNSDQVWPSFDGSYIPLLGLLVTLASAYRLAKYTLLIISLPLIIKFQPEIQIIGIILNPWFLIGLTILSCYLLNANIPLFSLKFKTWGFKENKLRYIFLLVTIVLIVSLKFIAIPLSIVFYVLCSMLFKKR